MKRNGYRNSILHKLKQKNKHSHSNANDATTQSPSFSNNIQANEQTLKQMFGGSHDLVTRTFKVRFKDGTSISSIMAAADGLFDEVAIRNNVLKPLLEETVESQHDLLETVQNMLPMKKMVVTGDSQSAVLEILKGDTLLLFDGYDQGLLIKRIGLIRFSPRLEIRNVRM